MSDCERYEAMISALLDGELSPEEEAEVRAAKKMIEDTVFRPAASLLASLLPACGRRGRTSEDFGRYR